MCIAITLPKDLSHFKIHSITTLPTIKPFTFKNPRMIYEEQKA